MAYYYSNITYGKFKSRPNRFTAYVEIDGEICLCHVKNTGRCKELLIDGCNVILQKSSNPKRKTKYDLISVYKGNRLINMDSQVPNKCTKEFLPKLFNNITYIKPECTYRNSRFDFYIETTQDKIFLEVKGVTLENDGVVMFPDAPTQRGVKHLNELIECISEGYKAYVLFVIQMDDVKFFAPNRKTHPEFAEVLNKAEKAGVKIIACQCNVIEYSIEITNYVPICLN